MFRAIFAEKFYQKNCTKIAASFRSGIVLTVLVLSILLGPQFALAYDVMAGGQSLGIVLKSEGAIVVGFTPVVTADGQELGWRLRIC